MSDIPAEPADDERPLLDHLALASRRAWDQLHRYGFQFGGSWLGGPLDPESFYFCQVGFANGTKLELLEPIDGEGSDFLRRFLDRNGPGPHHLTFKVGDIAAVMDRAGRAGYQVVNASLDDPDWKEAFLHPKQSHGIVIQLAQQGPGAGWDPPAPLPPPAQAPTSTIDRVTHLVADLEASTALFGGVLGMEIDGAAADGPLGRQIEARSGPWVLRLVQPGGGEARHWLGERTGRLLQVEMTVERPELIDGLVRRGGCYELPPEVNLGTRVLVRAR